MPMYDFKCIECDHVFEKRLSFHDEPLADCPVCNSSETRRLLSKPAIVFKGSGFYINDSKGGGKTKSTTISDSKENKGKEADSGDTSEAKGEGSDTKSEAKSETKADKPKAKEKASSDA